MLASAALVILGIILVVLGIFGGPSYWFIGFGIVALITAGTFQVTMSRRT